MKYFPLILFVPTAVFVWMAIVTNTKQNGKKLTALDAVLIFIFVVAFFLPASVWQGFFSWLALKVFNPN